MLNTKTIKITMCINKSNLIYLCFNYYITLNKQKENLKKDKIWFSCFSLQAEQFFLQNRHQYYATYLDIQASYKCIKISNIKLENLAPE